ncbi:hypothetical protein K435DRAFT_778480, partial [Dendrothele bispora CBS 962.96]
MRQLESRGPWSEFFGGSREWVVVGFGMSSWFWVWRAVGKWAPITLIDNFATTLDQVK